MRCLGGIGLVWCLRNALELAWAIARMLSEEATYNVKVGAPNFQAFHCHGGRGGALQF